MTIRSLIGIAVVASSFACGGSKATGTAHVVRGASTVPASSGTGRLTKRAGNTALATDGHYFISPTSGQVTITNLTFNGASNTSSVALTNCAPSYSRDVAELTSLLDCPITVDPGTYTALTVTVDNNAKVVIDDTNLGLFTDPNATGGLSFTSPAGGAQAVPLNTPSGAGTGAGLQMQAAFSTPLTVSSGGAVAITLLADMIHTVDMDVTGGVPVFDTSIPLPPVALLATAGVADPGQAYVEYYSPQGTADDIGIGLGTGNESGSLRVFYSAPNTPVFAWYVTQGPSEAWAADPAKSPGTTFKAGGYLGMDANGMLCFALPTDFTYTQYSQLCRIQVPTAGLGATTAIECETVASVPAPTAGDTYTSGCPTFTPNTTTNVTLVAR